ncbi:MAG: RNA polymerase factor sigma-54 [Xanthomonadaceae bacterium]|nr:RNA polymerase factor sigma-54 [Xanthomonadaceae bacterium]
MKQVLQVRLGQHLTMTPQMQQAIRLLQMSAVELKAEIQTALESNLMLEAVEDDEPSDDDSAQDESTDEPVTDAPDPADAAPAAEWEEPEMNWSTESGGGTDAPDWQPAAPEGLHEYLRWQVELTPFTHNDAQIAMTIVDYIGDDGYLHADLEEIVSALPDGDAPGIDEVEAVLHRIQHFDPIGVGARNLAECLSVQLGQKHPETPGLALARRIVAEHLSELADGNQRRLAAALGADAEELAEAAALVRSLKPRPAVQVEAPDAEYVIPDVVVTRRDDRWSVELNPELLPRLRINPYYAELARSGANNSDRACMRDHLQDARWLIKSLQSRAHTLLQVASFIVGHQGDYLDRGDVAMRPLVLREVAEALEMHESTISRVTANKYLHTPRGVVEFRHFFSAQLGTADGVGTSATAARARIRTLISGEDPGRPLSDGRIAELLTEKGLKVARRTVAKYRESMSIPPAPERRRG